ncbi:protein eyes shut [Bradysia coprophila]|uniref:protein eyes shut n=1 Tax=Bradysia coprophila TaxID=38358 RepID=UPI00187DD73E|nr:protein eyes shut [Bradysia coprophila]
MSIATQKPHYLHTIGIQLFFNDYLRSWIFLLLLVCCTFNIGWAGLACLSNPCVFGVCMDDLNSTYSCYCIDGYTGTNCQTNWDECWSSPCQNDGTCIDGVAAYNCSCQDGFVGLNCEENLNECLSNPCQNGGSCYDRDNSYVCVCQPGFLGSNCDVDVAVCTTGDERCYNGGECIEGVGLEFSCNCVAGYTGDYCDVEIDECESAPCKNGAICIDKLASYQCACTAGYTGENCEEAIMLCDDSPCQNNALCLMELGTPVCYCVPDFHGEKCEHKYDECELMSPRCVNGGTCIDGIDEYSCSCPPQITGMSCECLMLDTDDYDCNYTSDFTTTMFSTYETANTASPTVQFEITSTVISDATTEMATDDNSIIDSYETTTVLTSTTSTVELTTSISLTSESYPDSTTVNLVTTTTETTSDVTQFIDVGSITTEGTESETTAVPETTTASSVTTDVMYRSTTDYNTILDDTTLSNSFFTDYPTMKTTTESTVFVDKSETSTVDGQQPTMTTETTTEYVIPTTIEVDKNVSTSKPIACAKVCQNGGTCVSTPEGGDKCKCPLPYEGSLCETRVSIQNAAFNGNSFISHIIHPSAEQSAYSRKRPFNIQVEVNARTRASDGLILLATAQSSRGNYYMALFLHRGLLQFQFSCGQQTMLLSELEMPVNTGDDISIQAELDFIHNYTHCKAFLRVNDTLAMSGYQPTWLNLLPLNIRYEQNIENSWLHLGGTPQAPISLVNNLVGKPGFTGCMQSLRINGQSLNIFGDAVDTIGITECGSLTCLSNPCQNRGICVEEDSDKSMDSTDVQDTWHCKCPPGFRGKRCEISVCENNPCQYGSTCVLFPGSGYLCLCPYGKHGHFCEHNLEIAQPHFSGSVNGLASYVAYPVQLPLDYSMELSLNILPTTMTQISLVAFIGQNSFHDDKSDHMAISFVQGYIMLTWNLGSGPRRIFTEKPVEFKETTARTSININVGRLGRRAWLSVDGKYNVSGRSPGSLTKMNVEPIVYLGGHKMSNFSSLPHDLPLHMGFQGCIFDVHFKAGMVVVPLQETRGVQGRGVGQCGTKECHRHACQNGGACLNLGSTFSCICQEGFFGPLCAQRSNPCDEGNNKCFTGSICVALVNGYECDCPLGRTGQYCESELTSLSDVGLSGRRSFLEMLHPGDLDMVMSENEIDYQNYKMFALTNANSSHSQKMSFYSNVTLPSNRRMLIVATTSNAIRRVQYFSVEFQIKPLAEKGLLLFYGSFQSKSSTGFISLSLQGGVVEFRILTTDQQINIVRSVRMLAIGEWHKVKASQSGRRISLWVEGTASAALASASDVFIGNGSHIFLGGVPDLSELPGSSISGYPMPMRGCLRHLSVNGLRVVLNESNIYASRNLYDCDGTPCGGDTCESEGQCWLDSTFQPHCKCPEVAKGRHCELKESCKYINCKNNGKCLRSGECSCPNGYGGFHCEIVTSKSSKPSFRGNSWLMVHPKRIPVKEKRNGPVVYSSRVKNEFKVSLNFSTISMDGLLLWTQSENGYVGLGIQNGQMKFASNLLNGSGNVFEMPNGGFVADGGWHDVQLEINEKIVTFTVDNRPIFTENQKLIKMRPSIMDEFFDFEKHPFFIGGLPNNQTLQRQTKNIFKKPFVGCLENINIGTEDLNDFSSYDGENIGSCDFDDFSYLQW